MFRKKLSVRPNTTGYLFKENKLVKKLETGIYKYWDLGNKINFLLVPHSPRLVLITNQEVLSKDNIAFRFSYVVQYVIADDEKFMSKFDILEKTFNTWVQVDKIVHELSQVNIRKILSELNSEEINEKRGEILNEIPDSLTKELGDYGIVLEKQLLKDITFPKMIQDLFAKQLEAKVRARSDLENARTAVATTRALKNASELMKNDANIKYFQFLETITKIAAKGKHSFVIGEIPQEMKKQSN